MTQNPTKLNNGPGSVSGGEPVAKALGLSTVAAAVVTVAAWLGLDLDAGEVVIVLAGLVALANLVAGVVSRRSVTPNGLVEKRSDVGRARLGALLVVGLFAVLVLAACDPRVVPISVDPNPSSPPRAVCFGEGRIRPDGTGYLHVDECASQASPGTGPG